MKTFHPVVHPFHLFCLMHFKPSDLLSEIVFKTSRSGGKGGQHVNKVSTKVLLEFNILSSQLLNEEERSMLMEKLSEKLTKDGVLQVVAQKDRSQLANKETALNKLFSILNKCFEIRKKRRPTKPTRSSVQKRLSSKKKHASIKNMRKITDK